MLSDVYDEEYFKWIILLLKPVVINTETNVAFLSTKCSENKENRKIYDILSKIR